MKELISITGQEFSGEHVDSVDARQLHEFLGSKQQFSHWIKTKVINNPFFMQGVDFIILGKNIYNPSGGRPRADYALTLPTSKKLAMSEQTKAGDKARDYFLKCEEVAKEKIAQQAAVEDTGGTFELEMIGAKHAADLLDISANGRLQMAHKIYEHNKIPTLSLPQYVEHARTVCSATDLLKKNDCEMKVVAFNRLLTGTVYADVKTRLGTGGVTKKYNALTKEGLKYGQNDSYRGSATQTQIHLYEDTFMDLYKIVCGK